MAEATSEDELWAAACLRIRTFRNFRESVGIEDHKRYLAEREFEAIKERVAGKRTGLRRVSCINATLPLSHVLSFSDDLCSACKFSEDGEERVLVGSLDLNQCLSLPDEIIGMKPQGTGADFARAYLSNVCVAKELQRHGLGYALIAKSKMVAEDWVCVVPCRAKPSQLSCHARVVPGFDRAVSCRAVSGQLPCRARAVPHHFRAPCPSRARSDRVVPCRAQLIPCSKCARAVFFRAVPVPCRAGKARLTPLLA
ncbi:GCN5-related N-acetyltransferase 7, chloroplastic-like isoform X1 [Actinidia eriantha]|uniref:GCN5-related N-acetyltransferase 7, chloroplastic-like isoform X1 n=1 Tax=Actinidia eriantha TaxID=165200 RepID=UPI00258E7957|nr:GCN5-related N-acetyltransferase 7, chloroplastic-like isoform X1 [Actinidia eriantha]